MISIHPATPADESDWLTMRGALWPDDDTVAHRVEIAQYLSTGAFGPGTQPWVVFIARDDDGTALGFAEASVRPCAEGCDTARVAYLEGWYVGDAARQRGVGRALVAAVEAWGRDHGCTEFASDTEVENTRSRAAHVALGFTDLGAFHCFRKPILPA